MRNVQIVAVGAPLKSGSYLLRWTKKVSISCDWDDPMDSTPCMVFRHCADVHFVPLSRYLGIVVCRGTAVMTIMPYEGTEEIQNPFNAGEAS